VAIEFARSWSDEGLDLYRVNVIRFIETEMLPRDEEARKRGHVGHDLWLKAGELGLLCADIPEEYGGGGGDFRHEAVFYEEMARRGLTGMNTSVHTIVAHYFLNHGTEEQRRSFLPRMARGELIGAIAMTEPGTDRFAGHTHTRRQMRNVYRLSGQRPLSAMVSWGVVLELAKTDPHRGSKGTSILIVETRDCLGFRVGRLLDKIGLKAQDTSELFFESVDVPTNRILGEVEGRGFSQLMADLPYERTIIGLIALATMEGAYQITLDYVRERRAFGQAIVDFQNTRFKLAEIATQIKVGRAFVDRCVDRADVCRCSNSAHLRIQRI
jgi:acyl-CoA dehydrogenase